MLLQTLIKALTQYDNESGILRKTFNAIPYISQLRATIERYKKDNITELNDEQLYDLAISLQQFTPAGKASADLYKNLSKAIYGEYFEDKEYQALLAQMHKQNLFTKSVVTHLHNTAQQEANSCKQIKDTLENLLDAQVLYPFKSERDKAEFIEIMLGAHRYTFTASLKALQDQQLLTEQRITKLKTKLANSKSIAEAIVKLKTADIQMMH